MNDYVHIEAADLRRPNARFTTERQGYQVLTPFGKLGYSHKIAASSDCSRPVNDYVHIEAADLRRPNARFTTERQGYQVLTPFGKLGYSQLLLPSLSPLFWE